MKEIKFKSWDMELFKKRKRNAMINIFLEGLFTLNFEKMKNASQMANMLAILSFYPNGLPLEKWVKESDKIEDEPKNPKNPQ